MMLLSTKYRLMYEILQKREKHALKQFVKGAHAFGPMATHFAQGFMEQRLSGEEEFSKDARQFFQRAMLISGGFANYARNFVLDKPWLDEISERELEDYYKQLTFAEKWQLFMA